ncbi:MAG TPA: response regulator [Bacteroidota bacterium]|nr:response regulator [Bacteroidota bacterium]
MPSKRSHKEGSKAPGPLRILLVEDNPSDAELIEFELRNAGLAFSSRIIDSENEFIEILSSFAPDLILSDFSLPQFTAFHALEHLKERRIDTPFILVTGSQSEEVAVECIRRGADDYILKQSLTRLPTAIESVLKKKAAERNRVSMEEELKNSNRQLRALSVHLQSVREDERTQIAREVHDELGQTLTGLRLDIAWLEKKIVGANFFNKEFMVEQIQSMSKLIDGAIQNVRKIATELRPRVLDDLGLIPTLEWQTSEFRQRTGIECIFRSNVDEISLDSDRATALFRILQESLTNVARHSNAKRVSVSLQHRRDSVILEIMDNGVGIQNTNPATVTSLGLLGMRERAEAFGGSFSVTGIAGKGTTVTVKLPISRTHD